MTKNSKPNTKNSFLLWLRIIRPQTLFASLCPVLVGILIAHKQIGFWGIQGNTTAVLTIICALSLQILSNLINDYYDYRRGTDKAGRVGFKRALAEGQVTESEMRLACFITLGIALVLGAMLCFIGGWVILLIGVSAIFFAWLYTGSISDLRRSTATRKQSSVTTNHSLSYLGIADIFVFLYYGLIATAGTTYLLYKSVGLNMMDASAAWYSPFITLQSSLYAGAVCGLISMCVLAINNIRDMEDDRIAGKRTFPVRFGKTAALVGLGIIVALMPLFAWLAFGLSWAMLILLPAAYLYYKVLRAKGAEYNQCLMMAGMVNLCFVILVWISL